jgi:cellulose biosynthesis protein BcsQ
MPDIIRETSIRNVWIAPGSQPLESLSHSMNELEGYESLLAEFLSEIPQGTFDYVVIDCPNQISPLMENAIVPTDVFIVPIESTKAVASYANFFALVQSLRTPGTYTMLHVLNNISLTGVRKTVLRFMEEEGIPVARTEIRNCGWLAQVDRHGGSIFDYRPHSKGAEDIPKLQREVLSSIRSTEKRVANA